MLSQGGGAAAVLKVQLQLLQLQQLPGGRHPPRCSAASKHGPRRGVVGSEALGRRRDAPVDEQVPHGELGALAAQVRHSVV